ncbi:MAG: leucine-rich repeat domain-containing protein, partial [Kiritimatiellae bacterium]|nr:leucine-rich repeat domain-containing protein [Kiritimatiellia bacterium]
TSLTSITIPDSVTSIGDYAFSNCKSLTSVTIPQHVKKIGSFVFYDCVSLTNILFTGNVLTTGASPFSQTPATLYYLPGTTGWASNIAERPAVLWNHATPTP